MAGSQRHACGRGGYVIPDCMKLSQQHPSEAAETGIVPIHHQNARKLVTVSEGMQVKSVQAHQRQAFAAVGEAVSPILSVFRPVSLEPRACPETEDVLQSAKRSVLRQRINVSSKLSQS